MREKSESFVDIRSTRHGGLIKGLFQSLTESSREEEMIKTQSALLLSSSSPLSLFLRTTVFFQSCPTPPHSGLLHLSVDTPLAILINVILQPQFSYLQFVSRKDAKSRRSSFFYSLFVPSIVSFFTA